jgi:hypothetical protein
MFPGLEIFDFNLEGSVLDPEIRTGSPIFLFSLIFL